MQTPREIERRASMDDQQSAMSQIGSFERLWDCVSDFAKQMESSPFMSEMAQRSANRAAGLMGRLDCAMLYGLTRWRRPMVVVESGGYLGMSSAFILKALADEGLDNAKLFSIESDEKCDHGALIPGEFRAQFVPVRERVEDLLKRNELPGQVDMFLHDSSHRYRHMLWEFREFWRRLGDGGLLVSHDVHFNPAFAEFVAKTQARDIKGVRDSVRTSNYEWGRWGYIGFIIKKMNQIKARPGH
jgi:predicted O-methyltransferase YrrM